MNELVTALHSATLQKFHLLVTDPVSWIQCALNLLTTLIWCGTDTFLTCYLRTHFLKTYLFTAFTTLYQCWPMTI